MAAVEIDTVRTGAFVLRQHGPRRHGNNSIPLKPWHLPSFRFFKFSLKYLLLLPKDRHQGPLYRGSRPTLRH